ncbi:MAG: SUMF1/EgtB/PvdO family nonheme iron enzyme, partial [Microcystis sp. M53603_WE2]|uniref:formylglycine-generating enzyme family protein n=2 Tax=Microcystis TaxID=1125 RepID=UPI0025837D2A
LSGFQLFLLINILHNSYQVSKRATPLLPNHYRNVWEWCQDDWCENYEEIKKSKKQQNQAYKVLRGGSWFNDPDNCRSAYHYDINRRDDGSSGGFRVVRGAGRTL